MQTDSHADCKTRYLHPTEHLPDAAYNPRRLLQAAAPSPPFDVATPARRPLGEGGSGAASFGGPDGPPPSEDECSRLISSMINTGD
jgi:hypothetical protein